MDRSTDPTDELFGFAREAYACADYEQAVYFLRKASSLAPMRQDIRQFLAEVLARSEAGDSAVPGATFRPPAERQGDLVAAHPDVDELHDGAESAVAAPGGAVTGFLQQSLRRLMERLPVRPLEVASPPDSGPDELPVVHAEIIPVLPRKLSTPAMELAPATPRVEAPVTEPEPFEEFDSSEPSRATVRVSAPLSPHARKGNSETAKAPDFSGGSGDSEASAFEDPPPAWKDDEGAMPSPRRRSRSAEPRRRQPLPERDGDPVESEVSDPPYPSSSGAPLAAEWFASLPSPSRRTVFFLTAYSVAVFFSAMASHRCYQKFFAETAPRTTAAANLPPAAVQQPAPENLSARPAGKAAQSIESALRESRLKDALALYDASGLNGQAEGRELASRIAAAFDARGTSELRASRIKAAIADYETAARLSPADPILALHLGNACYHAARGSKGVAAMPHLKRAEQVLRHAIQLDGSSVEALHRLATVYVQGGRKDEARQMWNQAFDLLNRSLREHGPQLATYERLAMIAECLGRKSEAVAAYRKVVKLARPGSVSAKNAQQGLKALSSAK